MVFYSLIFRIKFYPENESTIIPVRIANGSIRRAVVLESTVLVSHFNSLNVKTGNFLQILNERIVSMSFTMYFRKNSYLLTPVNEELRLYITHGLLLHWERRYIDEKFIGKKFMQSYLGQIHALRWQDLNGLFEVCGCLLGVATVCLILEVYFKKIKN